ncbi:uracil phosphoribosyltransferase [Rhabdothermincola salaria]|uniref:uracil phosphoribosyltransferase n=1 Tax=Rhabdothermincola salaria TaxID=2903142 RepID=UPI0032119BDF
MDVTVIDHPLAGVHLATLRSGETSNAAFRQALHQLGVILLHEATRDLPTEPAEVVTPLGVAPSVRLAAAPVFVPVLRAGTGLLGPALDLVPDADVGFVGLARDETTFEPHPYLAKLPDRLDQRRVIVLDPMLATGGTLAYTCRMLLARGAAEPVVAVCVVAAPEGLALLEETGLAIRVITAAVDDCLDERAYIVPGLGDAGDRQFGLW